MCHALEVSAPSALCNQSHHLTVFCRTPHVSTFGTTDLPFWIFYIPRITSWPLCLASFNWRKNSQGWPDLSPCSEEKRQYTLLSHCGSESSSQKRKKTTAAIALYDSLTAAKMNSTSVPLRVCLRKEPKVYDSDNPFTPAAVTGAWQWSLEAPCLTDCPALRAHSPTEPAQDTWRCHTAKGQCTAEDDDQGQEAFCIWTRTLWVRYRVLGNRNLQGSYFYYNFCFQKFENSFKVSWHVTFFLALLVNAKHFVKEKDKPTVLRSKEKLLMCLLSSENTNSTNFYENMRKIHQFKPLQFSSRSMVRS